MMDDGSKSEGSKSEGSEASDSLSDTSSILALRDMVMKCVWLYNSRLL